MSDNYEETFYSLGGQLISIMEVEEVIDLLGNPERKLILDIGTGTGRIARHLLKSKNNVVGIDICSNRLKLALKKANADLGLEADNYHLVVADGHFLPFKTEAFDQIVSIRTLKYFKNPSLGFLEIARVLKKDGVCLVELSNCFGYESFWLFLLRLFRKKKYYARNMGFNYQLFNVFKVERSLMNLNLIIVSKKAWHKIPTLLFIGCSHITLLKILLYAESLLQRILPSYLFSRGILIKFIRKQ